MHQSTLSFVQKLGIFSLKTNFIMKPRHNEVTRVTSDHKPNSRFTVVINICFYLQLVYSEVQGTLDLISL
jgi:hypothetical protein